jgi:LL-diaminopimelate aminotransferase
MIKINENYKKLQGSYLFAEIARRVKEYTDANPDKRIIKLGIGDVTRPLPDAVIEGLNEGVSDMGKPESFKGYGSYHGYEFLRESICKTDFLSRGVDMDIDEIFISTGAKEDTANFQELFSNDIKIAVPDPVYPVYVDSNVMAGRSGDFLDGRYSNFVYLEARADNDFIPSIPDTTVDLIYLCFPNNPTGKAVTKDELKKWVDFAHKHNAVILFDAAYEAFIREDNIPHSIFEIDGAKEVAVEFRSLSKTAGFTGTRLSYTIVPKEAKAYDKDGTPHSLNSLWYRRQSTKFNGTAYIIQKGAYKVFTEEGQKQVKELIDYYLGNAKIIREGIESLGLPYTGGVNSPYVWFKAPDKFSSWDLFDLLLEQCCVVGTPGSGFGKCGDGYFRLSAFGNRDDVVEAVKRLKNLKW